MVAGKGSLSEGKGCHGVNTPEAHAGVQRRGGTVGARIRPAVGCGREEPWHQRLDAGELDEKAKNNSESEEKPLSLSERAELIELRKKYAQAQMDNAFLKTAAFFASQHK